MIELDRDCGLEERSASTRANNLHSGRSREMCTASQAPPPVACPVAEANASRPQIPLTAKSMTQTPDARYALRSNAAYHALECPKNCDESERCASWSWKISRLTFPTSRIRIILRIFSTSLGARFACSISHRSSQGCGDRVVCLRRKLHRTCT